MGGKEGEGDKEEWMGEKMVVGHVCWLLVVLYTVSSLGPDLTHQLLPYYTASFSSILHLLLTHLLAS